jgi:hypothetical protein
VIARNVRAMGPSAAGAPRFRLGARLLAAGVLALASLPRAAAADDAPPLASAAAPSDPAPARGPAWFALGLLAGGTLPDSKLADYQWNTSARPSWGAEALAGRGPLSLGARLWSTQTTQQIDLPGASVEPQVRLTRVELVGMGRVATLAGTGLLLSGDLGRLHIGYHPDQVTIPVAGPGVPIVAQFSAIDEWTGGGGVAIQRGLGARWILGLGVEHDFFGLDTAHRSGAAVVYGRESLGDWSAHLEVVRRFQL